MTVKEDDELGMQVVEGSFVDRKDYQKLYQESVRLRTVADNLQAKLVEMVEAYNEMSNEYAALAEKLYAIEHTDGENGEKKDEPATGIDYESILEIFGSDQKPRRMSRKYKNSPDSNALFNGIADSLKESFATMNQQAEAAKQEQPTAE